jgi:hypothetical protein
METQEFFSNSYDAAHLRCPQPQLAWPAALHALPSEYCHVQHSSRIPSSLGCSSGERVALHGAHSREFAQAKRNLPGGLQKYYVSFIPSSLDTTNTQEHNHFAQHHH